LKARLPSEATLQPDMCLRLRGTGAFGGMVSEWLKRDAEPVDWDWTDSLTRHFKIPREQFLAAWVVRPRTVLLWTQEATDPHADVPTRLCLAHLNDAAVARLAVGPPGADAVIPGDDPVP